MNRAEKRRQKKLAAKAGKSNRALQTSLLDTPQHQNLTVQQAIDLAVQHHVAGELSKAERIYQQILQTDPNQPVALNLLGVVAQQSGKNEAAVDLIGKSIANKPDYRDAHFNLGISLQALGNLDAAVDSYRRAIAVDANYGNAHYNLGICRQMQGDLDGAAASYQKALLITPDSATAQNNLSVVYAEQGKLVDAVASYRKTLAMNPAYAEAHNNLAGTLKDQGRTEEAIEEFEIAISLSPENDGWRIRKALTLPVIVTSMEELQGSRARLIDAVEQVQESSPSVSDPVIEIGSTNFHLAYHAQDNRSIQERIAELHLSACPKLAYEATHCQPVKRPSPKRLRIGFLSVYLQNHTIGKLFKGIIENFSKDHFEVFYFQFPGQHDETADAINRAADKTIQLSKNLSGDRGLIAREELDVLFYPEIGMDPYTYFMSFARLAPVQAVGLGHPDTTGIPNIDYFVSSDMIELPNSATSYAEQLIQLSLFPTYYYRPEKPQSDFTRNQFGLPDTGSLYLCPQALFKFHPEFDGVIKDLLQRDEDGFLVLIDDGQGGSWRELITVRFNNVFPELIDRVIFIPKMPMEKFLGLLILADAILDIPTFSGGNTTLEAFAMEAPIVTWPGEFMRSRVTAGCYWQMGLNDLVASNADDYVSLALKLANDHEFKNRMRRALNSNVHKLFERVEVVREMEALFTLAYNAFQKGEMLSNEEFRANIEHRE